MNVALVTGASSGIGLAISGELARLGYPLLMVSNEEEPLTRAAAAIHGEHGVAALPLCMDLAQPDSARRLFDYCAANNLTVTVLVNNAGMFFFKDIIDTPPERVETMINLHVVTPALLCRLFAPQMAAEGGYILNMASIAARMVFPGITLYSATKSFLHVFSRAMHHELVERGLSITAVCPGAAATGLYNLPPRYIQLGVRLGIIMPTERLARLALRKMFQRKAEFIPGGLINRLFIFAVSFMPARMIRYIRKKLLVLQK